MKNIAFLLSILSLLSFQGCDSDSEETSPKGLEMVSNSDANDNFHSDRTLNNIHYIVVWEAGNKIYKISASQDIDVVLKILDSLEKVSPNKLGAIIPNIVVDVYISDGIVDHRYELYETVDGTAGNIKDVSSIIQQFAVVLQNARLVDTSEDIFKIQPPKHSYLLLKIK